MSRFITATLDEVEITRAKDVEKHGDHDQSEHGNWATGQSGSSKETSEYPTKESNPELTKILRDYIVEYPQDYGHRFINRELREKGDTFNPYKPPSINKDPKTIYLVSDEKLLESQKEFNETVKSLDKLVELSPALTEPTTTYRGIGTNFAETLKEKGIGATYKDNGFVSLTLDKEIATGFPSLPTGNIMEIVLPKGTKAINPSKFWTSNRIGGTELKREKELILGRGTKFEILSIEDSPVGVGNLFKVGIKS